MEEDMSFSTSFSSIDAETVMMNMRHQDETQFYTLVKMHLSFILHFTVDEVDAPVNADERSKESSKKILPFSTKSKNKSARNGEAVTLSHEGVCQAYQLIEFLSREDNLTHEGLFRKTGNIARQQELRQDLMAGSSIDFESGVYTAHDCASVLKGFLASLSEPLLTKSLYPAHCQVADICPEDTPADKICAAHNKQVKALQLLFLLIPAENYQLLKDLLLLLHKVSRRHSENKMNALNLGTMFAPHILCPRKMSAAELQTSSGSMAQAVALMIENAPLLFKVPHELEVDMRAFLAQHDGTPGLNRRRQRRHSCSDASMDSPQASTVFTFVDRQQSAAAGEQDDTETALAGLYAHISSMPDSARRRKLIKQFNRESGAGTPTIVQRTRTRSFGESLRKHLFFAAGRARKPAAPPSGKSALPRRSASEEALASPPSPDSRRRYRQEADGSGSSSGVSMCPTPSLLGSATGPTLRRSLLTPTAAAGRFTPRLARSLRQVQRESVPVTTLPGSARRPDRSAQMSTFRAGRNNSLRRGQVPLRPVRVDAVQPPPAPSSPISQKMDAMCSTTRVQMLTPRNRRAVCLLSQSSLPPASSAAPATSASAAASASTASSAASVPAPPSPVRMAPLDDSPSAPKRARAGAPLTEPFQRYLLQRDMLTAEPVDLSLMEVTSPPPPPAVAAVIAAESTAAPSPRRLLAGEAALSDSLLACLDGAEPDGATPASDAPQSNGSATSVSDITVTVTDATITDADAADVTETDETDGTAEAGMCDDGYRSLTSASSAGSLPPASPPGPKGPPPQRTSLADLSNRVAMETDSLTVPTEHIGSSDAAECWTEAGVALPAEPPQPEDGENQRRKTLTDRDTNPMAHRKIGAPRKRRSVMFETHL